MDVYYATKYDVSNHILGRSDTESGEWWVISYNASKDKGLFVHSWGVIGWTWVLLGNSTSGWHVFLAPSIYVKMVHGVCGLVLFLAPSIYENMDIKKGILMQLFSGSQKDFDDSGRGKFR